LLNRYKTNTGVLLPLEAFNASLPQGIADYNASHARRQLDLLTSFGFWTTRNVSITCQSSIVLLNLFWESSIIIAPNGEYIKTVNHFDYGSGTCMATELTFAFFLLLSLQQSQSCLVS